MVDGSTRFGAFVRILLPLVGPGLVATSIFAFIQAWNEYIIAYVLLTSPEKQTLTVWLASFTTQPRHRLGAADGRRDADRDAGGHLLPARAAPDRLRADRRRGPRVSRRARAARRRLPLPGLRGLEPPDWLRRWLESGIGGVVLFARNVRDPEQVAGADRRAAGRAARPRWSRSTRRAATSRGSRPRPGSSLPGQPRARRRRRRRADAARGGGDRRRPRRGRRQPRPRAGRRRELDPANPIIGVRSFGSDPELVARHVAAFVDGPAERRGGRLREALPRPRRHRGGLAPRAADGRRRPRDAARRALLPFRAAVEAGVRAVMTAHIRVPGARRRPGHAEPRVLTGLLRDELGFGGARHHRRAGDAARSARTVGVEAGAVRALEAGADALCLGADLGPA